MAKGVYSLARTYTIYSSTINISKQQSLSTHDPHKKKKQNKSKLKKSDH